MLWSPNEPNKLAAKKVALVDTPPSKRYLHMKPGMSNSYLDITTKRPTASDVGLTFGNV